MSQISTLFAFIILFISYCSYLQASRARDDGYYQRQYGTCRYGEHVVGKWVYNANLTREDKSFYCCGWDNNDFLYNMPMCGFASMQGWQNLMTGGPTGYIQSGGHACTCDSSAGFDSRFQVHEREKYEWVPSFCFLRQWNATEFCELLGDRNILIRGDSTAMQSAATLINMLSNQYKDGKGCQTHISFSYNNLLGALENSRQLPLVDAIQRTNASIVILSGGAHFFDKARYTEHFLLLEKQILEIRASQPHIQFSFKTVNPGHVNCQQHTAPIDAYLPALNNSGDIYSWNMHPAFDNFARKRARVLGMPMIEMAPLYLRPDMHSDCLHACLPGPLDLFAILLQNMLHTKEL